VGPRNQKDFTALLTQTTGQSIRKAMAGFMRRKKQVKPILTIGALTLAAALSAAPAMAQSGATNSTASAPTTGRTGDTADINQNNRNPVMTQMGEARASKVIGSSVYNDHDEKVGSIDDLLVGKDGKINAVLSVGGFLGMGTKYVQVPFSELAFGNTQRDSDNRVVLKGATKESLKTQASYSYYKS
jgi:hypothetical protein